MTRNEFEELATKIEKHMQYINRKRRENVARSEDDYIRAMHRFNRLTKLHNAVLDLTIELASSVTDITDDASPDKNSSREVNEKDWVDHLSEHAVRNQVVVSTTVDCPCCYEYSFKAVVWTNKRECNECGHFHHYDFMFAPVYDKKEDLRELSIEDCII